LQDTEEDAERKKWAQLNSSKKARQKKTRKELEEEAARESNFKVTIFLTIVKIFLTNTDAFFLCVFSG